MTDFLSDYGVVVALVCAALAIAYGLLTTRSLLALSPGDKLMQELSAAVQEGAQAYLRRQYTDDRHRRRRAVRRPDPAPELDGRDRLRDRRHRLGCGRLHRHERLRARQRARGRGGPRRHRAGARGRVPRRRRHRHARRRPRAARRGRLLRHPRRDLRRDREGGRGRPHRPRLRRLADLRVRPSRRRHLHQGRRRRRRHRRQDRGRHPRGRPAQPGRDRRQRGRQRRRLRRHGGRPVRDLRGHRRGGHAARRPHVLGRRRDAGRAVPARARRRLDRRVDHRHVRGPLAHRQRGARALPGHDHGRRDRRAAVHPGDAVDDGRPQLRRRRPGRRAGRVGHLHLRADRPRRDRRAVRDHRLLHVDALQPGQEDRPRVGDRPRHEHHLGASRRACRRPRCPRS